MKILILDQHSDVTRSLLQQLQALGHEVFIGDSSIIPLKKWNKKKLQNNAYHYPFEIGSVEQLRGGEFDVFISLSCDFYKKLRSIAPSKTKRIFFNTQIHPLSSRLDNILSCDSRNVPKKSCLFVLTLPLDLHKYHGPNSDGHYIQLIHSFTEMAKDPHRIQAWHIFDYVTKYYNGVRKIITYGDSGQAVKDIEAFPKMFAQLHIKNWGSGNDYAILKGMVRGIPPILYKPFVEGSVLDQFISDKEAFFFSDFTDLPVLLEQIDKEFDIVKAKGLSASQRVVEFMSDPVHLERLDQFLDDLK